MRSKYKFILLILTSLSITFATHTGHAKIPNKIFNSFFYQYKCNLIDEFELSTGEKLNIAQFTVFSYLSWGEENSSANILGKVASVRNDALVANIVYQLGGIEQAYFFEDGRSNRYRIIIHKYDPFGGKYSGYLINTQFQNIPNTNQIREVIRFQQDLKCQKFTIL